MIEQPPDGRRRVADRRAGAFQRRYLDALRLGESRVANAVALEALGGGLSPTAVQARVIAPAMWAVGDLWAADALTIADEHLATAISQTVEAELFPELLDFDARPRERVVVAAAEGERHTLGARMAADVLEGAGFDVLYLGADVPTDALLESCTRWLPDVVALSATMPLSVAAFAYTADRLARLPAPPLVIVSGRGCRAPALGDAPVTVVEDTERLLQTLEQALGAPRPGPLGPNGPPVSRPSLAHAGFPVTPDAQLVATAATAADLSRDHARRAASLERIAFRDSLTGLSHRGALDDRLLTMARDGVPAAILMIDVDRLQKVNDRDGHAAGDAVLRTIATAVTSCLRPGDVATRYGGDEFTVVLPRTDPANAGRIAQRIRQAVTEAAHATVSIGVSELGGNPRIATMAADRALYEAKATGRDCVVFVAV